MAWGRCFGGVFFPAGVSKQEAATSKPLCTHTSWWSWSNRSLWPPLLLPRGDQPQPLPAPILSCVSLVQLCAGTVTATQGDRSLLQALQACHKPTHHWCHQCVGAPPVQRCYRDSGLGPQVPPESLDATTLCGQGKDIPATMAGCDPALPLPAATRRWAGRSLRARDPRRSQLQPWGLPQPAASSSAQGHMLLCAPIWRPCGRRPGRPHPQAPRRALLAMGSATVLPADTRVTWGSGHAAQSPSPV